jgi:endonuclease/exonuclease/phosphatase family metal-dependent hydrolase
MNSQHAPDIPPPRSNLGMALRKFVRIVCFGYTISLTLLFAAMALIGERWWPLAVALYLPQRIFLLPLIILLPAALLAEAPVGVFAVLFAGVIIFLWHVPFYPGMGGSSGPLQMKIMTNNYGQNHRIPIQPFIAAQDPDFVGLDEAGNQGGIMQKSFPDHTVLTVGQFAFISKTPVKSATSLAWPLWGGHPVAAVFVVPWHGQDVVFYTVHLPTPRGDFAKLAGTGLLKELLGRNRRRSDGMSFGEAMTARAELGREMAQVFAAEKRPFVAMGDFNMPPDGYVHRVVSHGLLDCFAQAGRGFGFTFPGDTWNPLTLGQPWLRIDYIFAGPGWRANWCEVEPDRRTQHRPVVAIISRN